MKENDVKIDARGKQCPLPVIEAKNALNKAKAGETVEILVDNKIAVQNLLKMAAHKRLDSAWEKIAERNYLVKIAAGAETEKSASAEDVEADACTLVEAEDTEICTQAEENGQQDFRRKGLVVVIAADHMGEGELTLGRLLIKGYLYALTQQDTLPETVLFYNGGAALTCEDSDSLEDLRFLAENGVEILTCGTCLNHLGLSERLKVGQVTNMYEIAERMTNAKLVLRP